MVSKPVERVFRSHFISGVATLVGGQGLAAAVPILTAPVLGRLYAPHDYGLLATYMSIAVVVSTIGNWQYAQAIVLESHDTRAWALVRVCVWTSLITAAGSALVPLAASVLPLEAGNLADLRPWLWLVPLSALLSGLTGCFTGLANRFKRYRLMAAGQIATSLVVAGVSMALGWLGWGADGLLTGYFAGQILMFLMFMQLYRKMAANAPRTPVAVSLAQQRRHLGYALYTMPTSFIEQLSANAPVYALGLAGAPQTIGLYSRARLVLALPLGLIGNAVAQVFQQRAAADVSRQGHCREIFAQTFLVLAGLGIVPVIVLAFAAPVLFALYLGPKWREAGEVARIIAPMLFLQVICSPLSRVFYLRHRQRLDLVLSMGSMALVVLLTGIAVALAWPPLAIVGAYVLAGSTIYVTYIAVGWSLAGSD
jgi:O-antigen/teichoic acid export membrane protein